MEACRKKKVGVAFALWFMIALILLLSPAPREWGAFGEWINSYYDQVQPILQPVAHTLLMMVGVFLLMEGFHRSPPWVAFLLSIGAAIFLALVFELMQGFLPARFARACDIEDLLPSMLGILAGGGLGFLRRVKKEASNK